MVNVKMYWERHINFARMKFLWMAVVLFGLLLETTNGKLTFNLNGFSLRCVKLTIPTKVSF